MKPIVMALVFVALALISAPAFAGPYLNASSMLLRESFAAGSWVRENLGDRELARTAHELAQARSDTASKLIVPDEVKKAHPHLLLSLGNMERAFDAASQGQVSAFVQFLNAADGEARTFKAILGELGYRLPEPRNGHASQQAPTPSAQPALRLAWRRAPGTAIDPAGLYPRADLPRRRNIDDVHRIGVDHLRVLRA